MKAVTPLLASAALVAMVGANAQVVGSTVGPDPGPFLTLTAAGLTPIDDWRGRHDSEGRELHATAIAVADEAAAAADLARTKDSREPIVVLRGLERHVTPHDGPGAAALLRSPALEAGERRAVSIQPIPCVASRAGIRGAPPPFENGRSPAGPGAVRGR